MELLQQSRGGDVPQRTPDVRGWIVRLTGASSVEMNVQDASRLGEVRELVPTGTRIFVTHLPRQAWSQTEEACIAVRQAGFEPVPHIPVRLMPDLQTLDRTLSKLVAHANVRQVLLISGDYASALGPFSTVADALRSGAITGNGIERVAIAGHPEGHPKVALEEIRRAEADKITICGQLGLQVMLVSQFVFESQPFLQWARELAARGISTPVVAGVAGPAGLSTLIKFAMRCGVGPSVRALSARPGLVAKLLGDYGPETLIRAIAQARALDQVELSGFHVFCFGGFVRSCAWLHAVSTGRFALTDDGGFNIARDD